MISLLFFIACSLVQSAFIDFSYGGRINKLYVPSNYDSGKSYPLFVMLHGCTQDPTNFAAGTQMNPLAETYGFLVLYPLQPTSANANKCWNWFLPQHQARGSGEPSFISGVTLAVANAYNIAPEAISVSGLSAGAAQAVIMGVTYPDIYCCVGVAAGLEFKAATTQTAAFQAMSSGGPNPATQANLAWNAMKPNWREPLEIVVVHGTSDYTVAPINGNQTTLQWILTNNLGLGGNRIPTTPTSVTQGQVPGGRSYTVSTYDDTETGIEIVTLISVQAMGHAWSGGSTSGSYTDPRGPSASEIIVKNFLNWEGLTTDSSTTGPSTTGPSTTGPSTTGPSPPPPTTTGPPPTTTGPPPTTTGGNTVIKLPSVIGQDGFVARVIADGYSTSVCKVGDKGMFSTDWFRSIIIFPTQDLPKDKQIESVVLTIEQISISGTINNIVVDLNNGPFGGSPALKPGDFLAFASNPNIGSFNPQTSSSVDLPPSVFASLTTFPTAFRLSASTTASFAQNLVTLGCGKSTLTITYTS